MTTAEKLNEGIGAEMGPDERIEELVAMDEELQITNELLVIEGVPTLKRLAILQELAIGVLRNNDPEAEVARFRDALKKCHE